jgi:hypothetical protein
MPLERSTWLVLLFAIDLITSTTWVLRRRITYREPIRPSLSSTLMFPTSLLSRSLNLPDRTLALTIVSASSLPDLGEGGPVMVDISNFTAAKILDERPSPSGVEYRCELEPLWLAADLVEKA